MWQRKKFWKRPDLKNHSRQYTSLNTNRNSAEHQGNEKGKCREFLLPRGIKVSSFYFTELSLLYSWKFVPTAYALIGYFEVIWHLTMKLFPAKSPRGQHCKIYDVRETKGRIFRKVLQPRSQGSLSLLRERTRVSAGHVPPRIWLPRPL